MSKEPDFISQSGEPMTPAIRMESYRTEVADAETKGANFHRFSVDLDRGLTLYGGWKARPREQGKPRFQMVAQP
jgi:hypothetical protein